MDGSEEILPAAEEFERAFDNNESAIRKHDSFEGNVKEIHACG